jgi:hypothetical protein
LGATVDSEGETISALAMLMGVLSFRNYIEGPGRAARPYPLIANFYNSWKQLLHAQSTALPYIDSDMRMTLIFTVC